MADRYEPQTFEAKWQARWKAANLFETRQDPGRPKFYGLDFFPYPSGAGLSVGHCRNYIPTDVICRMKFMQGYNVLHPMGFDAFGLPAENEAIKNRTHPGPMIERYAENYRRQMELIGIGYDWSRSFRSSDPEYYQWTQWIFKVLLERGLAYQRMAAVNWDPVEKTVLADEEVIGGLGWRSGVPVEKRSIPQWFFKITDYAQRLIDDLDTVDWPEGIKQMQRNWIGRSEGVQFRMRVAMPHEEKSDEEFEIVERAPHFEVFTTRIDTVYGMTFCVLAPEHPSIETLEGFVDEAHRAEIRAYRENAKRLSDTDRQATTREKTGVFTGAYAINPANGERVPIWIADYVLMHYGTGAIMAVPAHDARDYEFAQKYGIPVQPVIGPAKGVSPETLPFESKDGFLVHSGEYSGLSVAEAQKELGQWFEACDLGTRKVQYKLRDWLISRQRYWGCPIPVIHSADGEIQPVPDEDLPVELPEVEHYEPSGDGSSPLAAIDEWVNITDQDGKLGRRETDTMGGFACSSWYFLRFCDPHNKRKGWDPAEVEYWMPVDCYVGGAEHAVMHLLYARFWTKVLYDAGLVPVQEPFQTLRNQGMVLAPTPFRAPREGETLGVGEEGIQITFEEAHSLPEDQVFHRYEKMSKSKGNVVTPDEIVEKYGADALRLYELFVAPFEQNVQWSNEAIHGQVRFLSRVFKLVDECRSAYDPLWRDAIDTGESSEAGKALRRLTHHTIRRATDDISGFAFNTYVAAMMEFLNGVRDVLKTTPASEIRAEASEMLETFVLLLAPAAPHSADELWDLLGMEGFTYQQDWPELDERWLARETVTIAVQVNGKLRDTLEMPTEADQATLERVALESERVRPHLEGKTLRKVIVVPGKLVNLVVG